MAVIELRRLGVPLEDAARIAGRCHSGHGAERGAELPELIRRRRADVSDRIASLSALDARLAALERHLVPSRRTLTVLGGPLGACCDAAGAVLDGDAQTCGCCEAANA